MRVWLTFLGLGIKTPPRRLDQISIELPTKSVLDSLGRSSPCSTYLPAMSEASLKHPWKRRFSRPPKHRPKPHALKIFQALGIKFISSGPNQGIGFGDSDLVSSGSATSPFCSVHLGGLRRDVHTRSTCLDKCEHLALWNCTWVCLKMGYTPNYSHLVGIMILNHWV